MSKSAFKSFDLSVFDVDTVPLNQVASVVAIELSKIVEDPDQPRKIFDEDDLRGFAQEISARGVQSPIQVKRYGKSDQYQIIQGARRYRASLLAGCKVIPAIVRTDETVFDEYSQVTENTQREDLSPLDIARFIAKRKALGETNVQIAKNLNESKDYVGKHLALLEAPQFIVDALLSGVIEGAQSAYHLQSLHKKSPEAAEQLVRDANSVTQAQILGALKLANQAADEHFESEGDSGASAIMSSSDELAQAIVDNATTHLPLQNQAPLGESAPQDSSSHQEKIVAFRTKASSEGISKPEKELTPPKKPTLDKSTRLAITGVIQNLALQIGNKASKQVVFSQNEAKTLKVLLEGLL